MKQDGIERPSYAVQRIIHRSERMLILACNYPRRSSNHKPMKFLSSHVQRWYRLNFYMHALGGKAATIPPWQLMERDLRVFTVFKVKPKVYKVDQRWIYSLLMLNQVGSVRSL